MRMEKNTIVGLDIGTTKIGVVISEVTDDGLKIIGIGSSPSEGLRKGVVINIDKTVKSIHKAVEEAELMAGIDVIEVFVGIAGRHIRSVDSRGIIPVARQDHEISNVDVRKVIEQASTIAIPADREVVHVIPQGFVVDGQTGIKDPVGMSGVKLEGDVHIVTAAVTSAQNIYKSVEKAGIQVADIVLEPLASSYAVLDEDEKELGVALVDMGGGTTDIAVFLDESIRYTTCIDYGGDNVSSDLAMGIRTPLDRADEIKRKYGSCSVAEIEEEFVPVPGVGGRESKEIPKSYLSQIIRSRMKEIFEMVFKELQKNRMMDKLGAGLVLTGGGSLTDGAKALAEEVFGVPVRIGVPKKQGGISDAITTPIHATGMGLVQYGLQQVEQDSFEGSNPTSEGMFDIIKKISSWIAKYF
jgi:cell division protein FtsA